MYETQGKCKRSTKKATKTTGRQKIRMVISTVHNHNRSRTLPNKSNGRFNIIDDEV